MQSIEVFGRLKDETVFPPDHLSGPATPSLYRPDDAGPGAYASGGRRGRFHYEGSPLLASLEPQSPDRSAGRAVNDPFQDTRKTGRRRTTHTNRSLLTKRARRVIDQHTNLDALHQDVQQLRDKANYEWDIRLNQRRFVQDSQEKFMRELAAVSHQLPPDPAFSKLQEFYQHVLNDQQSMEAQASISRHVEEELSSLQHRMIRKEKSLAKSVQKLLCAVGTADLHGTPRVPESLPAPASNSPVSQVAILPEIDPLLAELYDKIGDVNVLRERVAELAMDHHEEQTSRAFLADQGEPTGLPDEDFTATYELAAQDAERALSDAIEAAEAARVACVERGIDLDSEAEAMRQNAGDADNGFAGASTPSIPGTRSMLDLEITITKPSALPLLSLDDRNGSSAIPTWTTESLNYDEALRRQRKKRSTRTRVEDWIQDTVPDNNTQGPARESSKQTGTFGLTRSLPPPETVSEFEGAAEPIIRRPQSEYARIGEYKASRQRLGGLRRGTCQMARRLSDSKVETMHSRNDSHQDVLDDIKIN